MRGADGSKSKTKHETSICSALPPQQGVNLLEHRTNNSVIPLLNKIWVLCVLVLLQCVEAKCVDIGGGVVGKREAQAQEVWVGCSDGEKIQNISKSCILDPSTFSKLRCCIIFTF